MRRLLGFAATAGIAAAACAGSLDERWVFAGDPLLQDEGVGRISNIVHTAKAGGMNGMLFVCGIDFCKFWPQARFDRLSRIMKVCEDAGIEIIPTMWCLGYGGLQNYGISLIEGMPVDDVPFVAEGTNAVYDAAHAKVQELSATSGFQRDGGYWRMVKKVSVSPNRRYRYSFEFKTEGLTGEQPFKVLAVDATQPWHERETIKPDVKTTQDWTPCAIDFNSCDSNAFYLYIGYMSGRKAGDFKLRNVKLAEIAPTQVLQRPGAPRVLRNAATGETYEEGRDYVVPKIRYPVTRLDWPMVQLALPPGSRVKQGDRLLFSCYAPAVANGSQVTMCPSEPKLYEALEDSAARIERTMHPKKWFISADEFRNGGTCAACRARGMTVGEMYADCITKAYNAIQKAHPGAEVYIWSDMLDPNHNAVKHYYNCSSSFEDSWKGVPKELIICCWYGEKADISMPFFSSHGFRTLAAAYYDEKPPFKRSRKQRDVVLRTEGARGIMYTTWRKSYDDLPAFCEMLKE